MDVQLTGEEVMKVDEMIVEHMWSHSLTDTFPPCDIYCRLRALGMAINKILKDKPIPDGVPQPRPKG